MLQKNICGFSGSSALTARNADAQSCSGDNPDKRLKNVNYMYDSVDINWRDKERRQVEVKRGKFVRKKKGKIE